MLSGHVNRMPFSVVKSVSTKPGSVMGSGTVTTVQTSKSVTQVSMKFQNHLVMCSYDRTSSFQKMFCFRPMISLHFID